MRPIAIRVLIFAFLPRGVGGEDRVHAAGRLLRSFAHTAAVLLSKKRNEQQADRAAESPSQGSGPGSYLKPLPMGVLSKGAWALFRA